MSRNGPSTKRLYGADICMKRDIPLSKRPHPKELTCFKYGIRGHESKHCPNAPKQGMGIDPR
ncbi:hypothetical protein MMC22_007789 [Lobaria immixta]|nr:hypothetical protein [Lobaria immixta]